MYSLKESMVFAEVFMSWNIPSSLEVNWYPHSVFNLEIMFLSASSEILLFSNNLQKFKKVRRGMKRQRATGNIVNRGGRRERGFVPSGQMLLVVFFENVLFGDEAEKHHHFVQNDFGLLFAALHSLPQPFIDK
jgi:hypothetical protein